MSVVGMLACQCVDPGLARMYCTFPAVGLSDVHCTEDGQRHMASVMNIPATLGFLKGSMQVWQATMLVRSSPQHRLYHSLDWAL